MHTIALISLVVGRLKKLLNAVRKRFQKKEPVFGPLAASEPDNPELITFLVRIFLEFV